MRSRAFVSVLTLVTFLPIAVGCSSGHSYTLADDPVTREVTATLRSGDPVRISGFTTLTDGPREWRGVVSLVEADSLEFAPRVLASQTSAAKAESFRLAREEVVSLEVIQADGTKTVATAALVLVGVLAVLFVLLLKGLNEAFDDDNWFQGTQ